MSVPHRGGRSTAPSRRNVSTRLLAAAAGVLLVAGVAACGSGSAATNSNKSGGTLSVVSGEYTWSSLDPAASVVTGYKGILYQIYDSLLRISPSGQLEPWLASAYKPSTNGLTWTFTLRQGVTFTDGSPFNSAAVKFNLLRQIDPTKHSGEGSNLPADLTVDTPNGSTVVVHLKSPDAALPWALASTGVGLMASPTAVAKYGAQYGLHPVGTGPFKLRSQVAGQTITLVKNPRYWVPGEPKLNTVEFSYIGSAESAYKTVTSGGAQIMDFVQPLQAHEVSGNSALTLTVSKATGVDQIWLNTRIAPFNNVTARRAIGYALDQGSLSKNLFYGYYKPTESAIGPGSWAYPGASVPNYPTYNLSEAKKLVQQLGGLSFTFILPNDTSTQEVGAALQQQMAAAGIKVTLKPEEGTTLISDEFTGNYQASNALIPGLPDPDSYLGQFFGSAMGATGINDPKLFSLFVQARATTDQTRRAQIYKQVAERMAELMPTVMVADRPHMMIVSTAVHGMVLPPFAGYYLDNATIG